MKNPILYISHGAPNTILKDCITKRNLKNIESKLGKPKYIIIISAHWPTFGLKIISPKADSQIYDFYGFEKELYEIKFDIKSDKEITSKVQKTLNRFNPQIDTDRLGYDHGVWTPLYMIFDKVEIPVIQLSLPMNFSSDELLNLGEELKKLKEEALIICSGSITHNLREISYNVFDNPNKKAFDFNSKIKQYIENGDIKEIKSYDRIEGFRDNHPTIEHFTPLLIALGASGDKKGKSFNSEFLYSNISMESYIFQ